MTMFRKKYSSPSFTTKYAVWVDFPSPEEVIDRR